MATNNKKPKNDSTLKNKLEYKDVSAFYKAKHEDPQTEEEFELIEAIYDDTSNPQYHSRTAEKKRFLRNQKNFNLKYNKTDKYIAVFESLINSYFYNIDKKIKYEEIKLQEFYYDEKKKRLYKIDIFDKKYFKTKNSDENDKINIPYSFTAKFISQDIIYKNEYKLVFPVKSIFENSKKNYYANFRKAKIIISRSMKTPFPLEYYSIKSVMVRKDFNREFKKYCSQIEKGINKELYKKND